MDASRAPFARILLSTSDGRAIALRCSSQARFPARIYSRRLWRACASAESSIRQEKISPGWIPQPPEVESMEAGAREEEADDEKDGLNDVKHVPRRYTNKFIRWVKLGSVINDAAMAFFKSEVRRRTFVTIVLLMVCRAGQFVPLPGFSHRTMPSNFLGSSSLTANEPKLSLFHLGLSPYICASTVIHLVCSWYPPFQKMRKDGEIDKIKSYTWWLTLSCSVIQSLLLSYATLQYATSNNLLKHFLFIASLLTSGALFLEWISRRITESGFGQGSTLIICMGILVSSSQSFCNMIISFSRLQFSEWGPAFLLYVGVFLAMTACAVLVTDGRRIVNLQFYGFDRFPSAGGHGIPEVEPYIPFDINPNGMLPVYMSSYLMAIPGFLASILKFQFLLRLQEVLNPTLPPAPGAKPWIYHTLTALLIFTFSVLDVSDGAKDISEYINRIGARITNVKPGRSTVEFLRRVQNSARTWGGILLALLVTVSTIVDYKLRSLHKTGGISFTSMLFIVGTVIEVRRSFMAYHAMHLLTNVLRRYGV